MKEPNRIMDLHKKLLSTSYIFFPAKGKLVVSGNHGVYIIFSPNNVVLHVGTTKYGKTGLNRRLKDHLTKKSSFSKNYLVPQSVELRNGYKLKYLEVNDARERALLEALTAGLLCPAHFGTGEKKNGVV